MKKLTLIILILAKLNIFSYSQNIKTKSDIFDITIDSLVKISIKKKNNKVILLKPYSKQTITKEQIEALGAADLLEVLRMVANIQFGTDVAGQLSIIVNGLWAQEGKVLLLWDGHPLNENLYGTIQLGRHYPIDNIKEIQIIKCPGSIQYGRYSELMIINIITNDKPNITNANIYVDATQRTIPFSQNASVQLNKKVDDWLVSFYARTLKSYRSNKNYYDIYGDSYNLLENKISDQFAYLSLKNKSLLLSILFDSYRTKSRDYFTKILSYPYAKNFTTLSFKISQKKSLTRKTKIFLDFTLQYNNPWESPEAQKSITDSNYYIHEQQIYFIKYTTGIEHNLNTKLHFSLGSDIYNYIAINNSIPQNTYWNNQNSALVQTLAFYSNLHYSSANYTIDAGLRYQYNHIYGSNIVPRLAIMLNFPKVQIKQIFTRASREPTIANINLNLPAYLDNQTSLIKPEYFTVINNEITLDISQKLKASILASYNYTHNSIVYSINKLGKEMYSNTAHFGTINLETSLNYTTSLYNFSLAISSYRPTIYDEYKIYSFDDNKNFYLGSSNIKLTSNILVHWHKLSFDLPIILIGPKYGYYMINPLTHTPITKRYSSTLLISPNLNYKIGHLAFSFGVYNILDSYDPMIQPYNGMHAPIPYIGRSIRFSIKYKFNY